MKKSFGWFFSLLTALAVSASALPGQTVFQWTAGSGGNDHYYAAIFSPAGINWTDAAADAGAHGGYLATISSSAENAFVFGLVNSSQYWINDPNNSIGPWLGGFQPPSSIEPAGNWQWVNGEGAFTYTNWAGGEPNNDLSSEDRLIFFGLGQNNIQDTWDDYASGNLTHGYIIESNGTFSVPEPSAFPGLFGLAAIGACMLRLRFASKPKANS